MRTTVYHMLAAFFLSFEVAVKDSHSFEVKFSVFALRFFLNESGK